MLYIIYYFLSIYLNIAAYAFANKYNVGIYLALQMSLTVPSSYYLAKEILRINKTLENLDNVLSTFLVTILLVLISTILSAVVIQKIKVLKK
jgi:hypothetical protein